MNNNLTQTCVQQGKHRGLLSISEVGKEHYTCKYIMQWPSPSHTETLIRKNLFNETDSSKYDPDFITIGFLGTGFAQEIKRIPIKTLKILFFI